MSAQIIQLPRANTSRAAPVEPDELIDSLCADLMPRLHSLNEARHDLDERFHRFLLQSGIIKETGH
jgi:hypothetical protein